VVSLEDVYDEFSHGLERPAAIRSFLRCASATWRMGPRYVVLAGDGTYDYRGHKGFDDNLVPALMVSTPHGLFACDGAYAELDGDGLADLALGRLPADSPAELRTVIAKLMAFEGKPAADWPPRMLLATDNADHGGQFGRASEAVWQQMPRGWEGRRVDLAGAPLAESRTLLFSALDDGVQFFNYFGHAGMDRLAAEGLLTLSDVPGLGNGDCLPVLTAMTCVMGQFSVPGYDCLGEALLLSPSGGVAAVWAPSGMSLNEPAKALCEAVYAAVFEQGHTVLGAALQAGMAACAKGQPRHTQQIYNLLGDPALHVAGAGLWVGFEGWRRERFDAGQLADPDVSSDAADPDRDGVPNLLEYAFGLDPWRTDPRPVMLVSRPEAGADVYDLVVTFQRRRTAPDLSYRLEVASDLLNRWLAAAGFVVEGPVSDDGNGVTETAAYYVRSPAADRGRGFVRLLIEKRP
jgi:hypothetical protein